MIEFEKPIITKIDENKDYGRFVIEPLERGYGISVPTMSRVFKALGIATATLDLGVGGKIALW